MHLCLTLLSNESYIVEQANLQVSAASSAAQLHVITNVMSISPVIHFHMLHRVVWVLLQLQTLPNLISTQTSSTRFILMTCTQLQAYNHWYAEVDSRLKSGLTLAKEERHVTHVCWPGVKAFLSLFGGVSSSSLFSCSLSTTPCLQFTFTCTHNDVCMMVTYV